MRCTAAASPAAQTRAPSVRSAAVTAATRARRAGRRRGGRTTPSWRRVAGSSSRASGWATSTKTRTGLSDREDFEELADGRDRRLVSTEEEGGGVGVDRVAPTRARRAPLRRRPRRRGPRPTRLPPSWTTISSSSRWLSGSSRSGVSVRMAGRLPSGSRNSLPCQVGMTSSAEPEEGSSSRTLAAGCSTTRPFSSGPATVDADQPGVSGVTDCDRHTPEGGGSRRVLPPGSVPTSATQRRDGDRTEPENERGEDGGDHRSIGHRGDDVHG